MLSCLRIISRLNHDLMKSCDTLSSFLTEPFVKNAYNGLNRKQKFHVYSSLLDKKSVEIRRAVKEAAKNDEGIKGAASRDIDLSLKSKQDIFPTHDLPTRLFDGVQFKDLPIISVKATRNNTLLSLSDQGNVKILRTCGLEGFKNARKGTNLAGQATGYSMGLRAVKKGYKNVRVVLKGLGPGRISSLKGLELGGMNIISVTDRSVDKTSKRPRKQKRL